MPSSPRPDPAQGVFETLLVVEGEPIELDAHMARLTASLKALFGAALPSGARDLVRERAEGLALGRLRLTVAPGEAALTPIAPGGADLTSAVVTAAVDPALVFPSRGADLVELPLDGGLGSHKWADRSPLRGVAEGTVPLLLDRGDEVLEVGRANVFVSRGGVLMTPAADGRILPGIARSAAIEVAGAAGHEVLERRIYRDDLFDADEVFLTGSVRGVEPARSLAGAALPAAGALSRLVAAGLRQRWMGQSRAAGAPEPAGAPPRGRPAR